MKILIQWATATPQDWQQHSYVTLTQITPNPIPTSEDTVGDNIGWINAINIQGVELFGWDHYNYDQLDSTSFRVTVWNDDAEDGTANPMLWKAKEIIFRNLTPDPTYGGAWNTNQTITNYEWGNFVPPTTGHTFHGIWVTDEQYYALEAARSKHGWREWTEGVPEDQIVDGVVIDQRAAGNWQPPTGTRTWYQTNTAYAIGTVAADYERQMDLTAPGTNSSLSVDIRKSTNQITHAFSNQPSTPGSVWPSGTYRCVIDCTTAGADITYGLLSTVSSGAGFHRVNSGGTTVETQQQGESAFSGTGLKVATYVGDWTGDATTDWFVVAIGAKNANTKSTMTFAMDVGLSENYVDGPFALPPQIYNETGSGGALAGGAAHVPEFYKETMSGGLLVEVPELTIASTQMTITNFNACDNDTGVYTIGPYKDTNGNLYLVGHQNTDDNAVMWKSSDDGTTWSVVGTTYLTSTFVNQISCSQYGSRIYVSIREGLGYTTDLGTFGMSDDATADTWLTAEHETGVLTAQYNCSYIKRASDKCVLYANSLRYYTTSWYNAAAHDGTHTLSHQGGAILDNDENIWYGTYSLMQMNPSRNVFYHGDIPSTYSYALVCNAANDITLFYCDTNVLDARKLVGGTFDSTIQDWSSYYPVNNKTAVIAGAAIGNTSYVFYRDGTSSDLRYSYYTNALSELATNDTVILDGTSTSYYQVYANSYDGTAIGVVSNIDNGWYYTKVGSFLKPERADVSVGTAPSGPNTYDETAQGGSYVLPQLCGEQVTYSITYTPYGVLCNGTADVTKFAVYYEDGSNGALVDGTATFNAQFFITPEFGVLLDSSNAPTATYNVAAENGVLLDSSNAPYAFYSVDTSNGVLTGGSAVDALRFNLDTSNGVLAGGLTDPLATYNLDTSNGALLSGEAVVQSRSTYNETMSGGALLSGVADESVNESQDTYNETMSGGAILNGAASDNAIFAITAENGLLANGTADVSATYAISTDNGVLLSGTTEPTATYSITAANGALLNGSATVYTNRRYWIASSTANFSDPANWSDTTAGDPTPYAPTEINDVYFGAWGDGICTIDVDSTVNHFYLNCATWVGSVDMNGLTLTILGNVDIPGSGTHQTLDNTDTNGRVILKGNKTYYNVYYANQHPNLTIAENTTVTLTGSIISSRTLTLDANSQIVSASGGKSVYVFYAVNGETMFAIDPTADIGANVTLSLYAAGAGVTHTHPAIDITGNIWFYVGATAQQILSGNVTCNTVSVYSFSSVTWANRGKLNLNGQTLTCNTMTVGYNAANPYSAEVLLNGGTIDVATNLTVGVTSTNTVGIDWSTGNVYLGGNLDLTYAYSVIGEEGVITFDGTGDQSLYSVGWLLPDIVINKPSGIHTFGDDLAAHTMDIIASGDMVEMSTNTYDIYDAATGLFDDPNVVYQDAKIYILGPQIYPPIGATMDGTAWYEEFLFANETMQGGALVSGTVWPGIIDYIDASSAGVVCAGEAEATQEGTYNEIMSGGALVSGTTAPDARYSVDTSNGVLTSGTADSAVRYAVVASNGVLTGGLATVLATYLEAAENGALISGEALIEESGTYTEVMSGGAVVNGTATDSAKFVITTENGALLSGVATVEDIQGGEIYDETMQGGSLAEGTALVTATYSQDTTAGSLVSGTVATLFQHIVPVFGGALVSGAATENATYSITTNNGALLGGIAFEEEIGDTIDETMSGGATLGGLATETYIFHVTGSGGAQLGKYDSAKTLIARPDGDIYTGQYWSPSPPYWSRLDDETDADSVSISLPLNYTDYIEVSLSGTSLPKNDSTLTYRMSLNPLMQMRVSLMDGTTEVIGWTTLGGGLQTYNRTLNAGIVAAITDPSNLRVRFTATGKNIALQSAYVHWCKLDLVPDMADNWVYYTPDLGGTALIGGTGTQTNIFNPTVSAGALVAGLATIGFRLNVPLVMTGKLDLLTVLEGTLILATVLDGQLEIEERFDGKLELKPRYDGRLQTTSRFSGTVSF